MRSNCLSFTALRSTVALGNFIRDTHISAGQARLRISLFRELVCCSPHVDLSNRSLGQAWRSVGKGCCDFSSSPFVVRVIRAGTPCQLTVWKETLLAPLRNAFSYQYNSCESRQLRVFTQAFPSATEDMKNLIQDGKQQCRVDASHHLRIHPPFSV